ncbi:hypothetical protein TSUD_112490 [Trifolium subterraneum]|uniref:Uncharacterized protein n=1 Tax=Trifolium subterraneum TaxID=3900 RepID=A0A2Z6LFU5_TRISU|nr:hypothetical protein TSUD_112490 [Trifolium subterraneum]
MRLMNEKVWNMLTPTQVITNMELSCRLNSSDRNQENDVATENKGCHKTENSNNRRAMNE